MGRLFGGATNSTTNKNPIADQTFNMAKPVLQYALNSGLTMGQNMMANPVYTGSRVAGMSGLENRALGMGNQQATDLFNAQNTVGAQALNNLGATAGFGNAFANLNAQAQNPYAAFGMGNALANSQMADDLVAASTRDIGRELYEQAMPNANRQYAATGNMNSSRAGIQDALLQRGAQDRAADMSAQIRQNMFNQGVGQYNTGFNNQLAAAQGLQNAYASGLDALGSGAGLGTQAINTLNSLGQGERGIAQAELDAQRAQFNEARDIPMNLLGQLVNLSTGAQGFGGSTSTTQSANPSAMQTGGNILGLAGKAMSLFS